MIDPTLRSKVEAAARLAAQRARQVDLDEWWQRIRAASTSPLLSERLEQARSQRWAGAIPTWEPVDLAQATNAIPPDAVGIDGSQIYPLEHGPFPWGYVQAVAYRKNCAPLFEGCFVDAGSELSEGGEHRLELLEHLDELPALVNAWRTLLEMRLARRAAEKHPGTAILLDGGLLPWLSVSGEAAQKHLHTYLADLLAMHPGLVAGVISGPQSRLLSRLVHLVEAESVQEGVKPAQGILDIALMRHLLREGQRSALFLHGSPRNEVFARHEAAVYFFFLRLSRQEIARIEIPEWVARDAQRVDVIHAAVLADARLTGYPYVLARAHQQVVVPLDVAHIFQQAGLAVYWNEVGSAPSMPAKRSMKQAGHA